VKSTDYPLHSAVSPSLPLPCVTVCHHISTGLYLYCGSRFPISVDGSTWPVLSAITSQLLSPAYKS